MRKVLVVEDEDAIREVGALNLRLAGYEVTEAASAEQALAVFLSLIHILKVVKFDEPCRIGLKIPAK